MTKTCVICRRQPIPGDFTRSFHKFPSNSKLRQKWKVATGVQDIKNVYTVCSDHFGIDSYHQTEGRKRTRRLTSTAVPLHNRNSMVFKKTNRRMVLSSLRRKAITKKIKENAFNSNNIGGESDVSQDSVTGIICEPDLSFHQLIDSETTSDNISMTSKRKQSRATTLAKKRFCFMDGCRASHVSREDFISDEAWGRFLKLMRYQNSLITRTDADEEENNDQNADWSSSGEAFLQLWR